MANSFNGRSGDGRAFVCAWFALISLAPFSGTVFGADQPKPTADATPARSAATLEATSPRPAPAAPAQERKPSPASTRMGELNGRLQALRIELDDMKTKYTDLHPDVLAKKRQIRQVQDEIRGASKR